MEETKTMATARSAVTAFADHCVWTGATANERQHWLLTRREGIGGSDAAAIMGVDAFTSELSVYVDKIGLEPPDEASSEVADWGRIFEPAIIKEYARRSGRRVIHGGRLMRSLHAGHHLVTLDGVQLTRPPPWAKGPGVAEVKTTGYGSRYDEDIPVEVQVQIQWEMAVTGASWATCIWLPFPERRMQWLDIEPHPAFQEVLRERVDAFWGRVQRREPPDPDASESSRLALHALYPDETDEVIRITGATAIADEFERNKAAIEVLKERQGLIKNVLAATIRDAKHALLDDGRYWGNALYKARENRCRHCSEVLSSQASYRTLTLREPRKKPFHAISAVRELQSAALLTELGDRDDLVQALEAALPSNQDQQGPLAPLAGGAIGRVKALDAANEAALDAANTEPAKRGAA